MKKLLTILFITMLTAIGSPAISSPTDDVTSITDKERAAVLINRLHEIKDMDKENLTRVEKKELRKEVKDIRKELQKKQNGIYLSVGAIIIIILLLILLL